MGFFHDKYYKCALNTDVILTSLFDIHCGKHPHEDMFSNHVNITVIIWVTSARFNPSVLRDVIYIPNLFFVHLWRDMFHIHTLHMASLHGCSPAALLYIIMSHALFAHVLFISVLAVSGVCHPEILATAIDMLYWIWGPCGCDYEWVLTLFWNVMHCSLEEVQQCFGGTRCLHLQGWRVTQANSH